MIFIGLDVSKISTALCIEKNDEVKIYSYTTKKNNNNWLKCTSNFINYRNIVYNYDLETDYSKSEILKLIEFDKITDMIVKDIFDNYNKKVKIKIAIEVY